MNDFNMGICRERSALLVEDESLLRKNTGEILSDYFSNHILKGHQSFNREYPIIRESDKKECWIQEQAGY